MSRNQRQDEEDEVRDIHTVPPSSIASEQFTTMSQEFNALVLAGGETQPLDLLPSITPDEPASLPPTAEILSLETVKREEVESRILSWQTAKLAKTNSRFKREEVDINGWEGERVERASAVLKKIEVRRTLGSKIESFR